MKVEKVSGDWSLVSNVPTNWVTVRPNGDTQVDLRAAQQLAGFDAKNTDGSPTTETFIAKAVVAVWNSALEYQARQMLNFLRTHTTSPEETAFVEYIENLLKSEPLSKPE
jgi:hypothetical protein